MRYIKSYETVDGHKYKVNDYIFFETSEEENIEYPAKITECIPSTINNGYTEPDEYYYMVEYEKDKISLFQDEIKGYLNKEQIEQFELIMSVKKYNL